MTHGPDCTLPAEILEQIAEQGLDVLPELIRIVVNTAMQAERQAYLGVQPYERSPARRDHGNGFKPKTVATRMGEITFNVTSTREIVPDMDFFVECIDASVESLKATVKPKNKAARKKAGKKKASRKKSARKKKKVTKKTPAA